MLVHSIKTVQKIPVSPQQAWDFFSDPASLKAITPGDINFKTITDLQGVKMHEGQIIEYKIKPLLGISFYWMTEIIRVKEKNYLFMNSAFFSFYSYISLNFRNVNYPV